jgi:preprotein translocase subunit SecF
MKFPQTNIDFTKIGRWSFLLSILFCALTLWKICFSGLHFGIDFLGGQVIEARLAQGQNLNKVRDELSALNLGDLSIQNFGSEKDILIKIEKKYANKETTEKIKKSLGKNVEYRRIETIGAKVGEEMIENGLKAVTIALICMFIYIATRFEWQFAFCATLTLLHDAIVILSLFSVFSLEFNETAITAILITIGYSINDTIVVFDRIRENMKKYHRDSLDFVINKSINETLSRTTLTVVTTLLALFASYFFGGSVISAFCFPIIIGIFAGTYSSILWAAPILVYLKPKTTS